MAERQTVTTLDEVRYDHRARYEFAARLVQADVIDVGCGVGYGSQIMAREPEVTSVWALDVEPLAICHAQEHWDHAKITWDARDAADIAEEADWAVCFEMLEHVPEHKARKILENLAGYCDHLVCSVPNDAALPYDPRRFPFHHRHYTAGEMKNMLFLCGWDTVAEWGQLTAHSGLTPAEGGGNIMSEARTIVFECKSAGAP